MHADYGGVVPELASRDHIRRVLPLTREVLGAAGADARLDRRRRLHPRPGPGRRAAGRRRRRLRAGGGARQAGARHPPPRRPSAVAVPLGRSAGVSRSSPCWSRAGTRSCSRSDDVGALHAARRHHRRCRRRGLRQVGQAARPRLSGRAGAGAAGRVRRSRGLCLAAAAAAARLARLLVRRPEDGGAHPRAPARGRELRAAARRPGRLDAGGDRRRAGPQDDGRAGAHRLAPARRRRRRRREHAAARATARRMREAPGPGVLPGAGALHRQRRDDRARRGDAAAARHRRAVVGLRVRRAAALAADGHRAAVARAG